MIKKKEELGADYHYTNAVEMSYSRIIRAYRLRV
jgi:hypothetical protein